MNLRSRFAQGRPGLYFIACLSGFAGLGYELTWTRMLGLALGHEIIATLCVVMGFFAGVALGSFLLGERIATSAVPARWYAGLEVTIAAWSVAQVWLLPWLGHLVPVLLGADPGTTAHWAVLFATTSLALLPATFAMGATLPALVAMLGRNFLGPPAVGSVYAANTFGAVAGTLLTTFLVAPVLGFRATLLMLAGCNMLCAILALATRPLANLPAPSPVGRGVSSGLGDFRILGTLFLTGFLGIGYEVLVIRVLSQLLENTVYTFAGLLAVYLLGTAIGGALHARFARRMAPSSLLDFLLAAAAVSCLLGTVTLFGADALLAWLHGFAPAGFVGAVSAEMALGAAAFLLPSLTMGALFSHLGAEFLQRPGGLGRAVGWNTLGAAAAPVLFGLLLLPALGAKPCLAAIVLGYCMLTRPLGVRARATAVVPGMAAIGLLAWPVSLQFTDVPAGGRLIAQVDGVMASVAVVQDGGGERRLQVNSHFRMGGTATIRLDRRQAYLPLLLHPKPSRALFLGLGTGTTIAAAADYPGLVTDGVELVPEILSVLHYFERSAGNLAANPALHLHVGDARRFVRSAPDAYDVIVADLYHPSLDGSGSLYTREHFAAVRTRLAPGGVFCQWLPLHQLDLGTLRVIVRSFLSEFPRGAAYVANFGLETPLIALIGQDDPIRYEAGWLARHIPDASSRSRLAEIGFTDDLSLFGLFLADAAGLSAFAGPGGMNTDDHPVVTFSAPGMVYAATDIPSARLMALVEQFHPLPAQLLRDGSGELAGRLTAYWLARDQFLALGLNELGRAGRATSQSNDMIERVAPELFAVLRISPDFDPAYLPLLAMANSLVASDPPRARKMLHELAALTPDRQQAGRLLRLPH